jgi:hypothetical protein
VPASRDHERNRDAGKEDRYRWLRQDAGHRHPSQPERGGTVDAAAQHPGRERKQQRGTREQHVVVVDPTGHETRERKQRNRQRAVDPSRAPGGQCFP